jgi:hypothetical protein
MKKLMTSVMLGFILISCQREALNSNDPSTCELDNGFYYYSATGLYDSVKFTYDNGQLRKAMGELYTVSFSSNGSRVTGRRMFENMSGELLQSDTMKYDSDSRLIEMTSTFHPTSFNDDHVVVTNSFSYDMNELVKLTVIRNDIVNVDITTTIYTFTNVAGNTVKLVGRDPQGGLVDSISYLYDSAPNYFKNIHSYFFLLDPFFYLHSDFVSQIPYFFSKNNVTRYTLGTTLEYEMAYQLDANNNPIGVEMGGSPYMQYSYVCK